jgi:hypothetical protein
MTDTRAHLLPRPPRAERKTGVITPRAPSWTRAGTAQAGYGRHSAPRAGPSGPWYEPAGHSKPVTAVPALVLPIAPKTTL